MTNNVLIRLARVSEQKELEALQWRASLRNAGDREALLANSDAIEIPIKQIAHGQVFVAEAASLIVGFAAILSRKDGDSELDALFVEPDKWRHGVGRELIGYCTDAARANGSGALHVIGNPHAEGFYLACGFELLGSTQTRFGTGLLLRKIL
jgi:N-acetylglutamate synthase-like GNAT family acetyltransferase